MALGLQRGALALALALQLSCSALVDTKHQCASDKDCAALGADFANTTCDTDKGICTGSSALARMCSKHSDCPAVAPDKPQVCRPDGQCVELYSAECKSVYPVGAEKNDATFLVGFLGLIEGDQASYGLAQKAGEEKAIDEINTGNQGLPAVSGSSSARTLAMLVCDHGKDEGKSATAHLAEHLKVPAILGASYSGVTLNAFEIAKQHGTLVFSPAATSPVISNVADPDSLLWRTVPSDLVQTEALKELVPLVTAALRASGALAEGQAPAIVLPYKMDPAGTGLLGGVTRGKNALNEPSFGYENPTPGRPEPNWDDLAARMLALSPNIILHLGTGEFVEKVMPRIEAAWPTGKPRPWYIVPEGDLEQFKDKKTAPLLQQYGIHTRLVGTSPGSRRSEQYRTFRQKFLPGEPGNLAEFAYDAVYLLSYAIGWTNKAAPTGVELGMGLKQTSCQGAPSINAGFLDFFAGWSEISGRGRCIDYKGASGDLNFNEQGEAESDIGVWCLQPAGAAFSSVLIDTYYPIAQRKLSPYTKPLVDFSKADWCTQVEVPL